MEGDTSAWDSFLLSDLPAILEKMQFTKAPIHFVLNKWDLFDNEDCEHDLEKVGHFLLKESEQFKNIVETRRELDSPVRLIPVSSVGRGFAVPQSNGSMKKTGKPPKPYQVEVPLACIVPDIMQKSLNELADKKKAEQSRTAKIEANLNLWERLTLSVGDYVGVGVGLGLRLFLPVDLKFTDNVIQKIGSVISSGANQKIEDANKRSEELLKDRDESIKQVESEETAINHTINSFLYIRETLEAMPGAKLN